MPLYGYGAGRRAQLAPGNHRPASKLFDLSMDDFDDIDNLSDLENLNFAKMNSSARPAEAPPANAPQANAPRAGRSQNLQLMSPPDDAEEAPESQYSHSSSQRSYRDRAALAGAGHSESLGASYRGDGGRGQGLSSRNRGGGDHLTALSDDERPPSPRDGGSATLFERHEAPRARAPELHGQEQADHDATGRLDAARAGDWAETPAYKLPPHPKPQGSTTTTRWRRRGRLGLAKPKRGGLGVPSDDSFNSHEMDGASVDASPPGSLGFLASSSSSVDQRPADPRSFVSGHGSMESMEAAYYNNRHHHQQQRGSSASLDEAADAEHTFQASRARAAGRAAGASHGSHEPPPPPPAGAASYESLGSGNPMEISDVSMNSHTQSPERRGALRTPDGPELGARPPREPHSSAGRHEASESRESLQSESARRRAMSPLATHQSRTPGSASRSPERPDAPGESGGSPLRSWNLPPRRGSPQHQQHQHSAVGSTVPEKRAGSSAMDISTRFQEYEKRINDLSPQYRSPRERHRIVAAISRGGDESPAEPLSAGRYEDSRGNHSAERQRMHGSSASLRGSDRHSPAGHHHQQQQSEERPEHRSVGYTSPRQSARRAAASSSSNFEILRGSTPMAPPRTTPPAHQSAEP
ncbi:hypothetical protein H4R18_005188, partial [Coemansia javaensis]